jgi:superfamily II RNA helicase
MRNYKRPRAYYGRRNKRPLHTKGQKTLLRPGADPRLKKIFNRIGMPDTAPFVADPFQLEALAAAEQGDCLVTAPTGAGKTWIALKAMERIRQNGGRTWYASPLKALTNAKMTEFSAYFGRGQVGILTGDRKENPDAPIIVGTTEILRNQLYDAMHQGKSLASDFVVLDEAHYLGDEERGVVWEETLIYLPRRIDLLLLSATIGNAHQIAHWLAATRDKACRVIQETQRPVPLYPLLLHPSGTLMPLLSSNTRTTGSNKTRLYKKALEVAKAGNQAGLATPRRLPPFGAILAILRKYQLLPAIFFLKSRADCDTALQLCLENRINDPDRVETLHRRMVELTDQFPHIRRHRQRWLTEQLAVGSHHSGQLPAWKQLLETLMSEGLLDAIFATSTVAAGVDFPARTAALLNSDRFNGREFMPLDATELHQMTGRAGRRGKDRIGFGLIVPGKFMDINRVANLFNAHPGAVHSQIRINFSMTLNLLLSHTPDQVKELLQRSLAAFQRHGDKHFGVKHNGAAMGGGHAAQQFLWAEFLRHLDFLQNTGFVDPRFQLTKDGLWASQLRIDQPLLVAEGLRKALFPQDDPALLAAVMASLVNEKETDEHLEKKNLPRDLVRTMNKFTRGLKGFAKYMQTRGFEVRPLYLRPAATLWRWAVGQPWDKTVKAGQTTEGDLAMLALRTADHLRHLAGLSTVFPAMAASAREAVNLILRDPVMPDRQGPEVNPAKPEI